MGKREDEVSGSETALEDQIRVTRAIIGKALKKGDTSNAVRAQTLLARLVLDLERRRAARSAAALEDPAARLAALRVLAEADGSWVAAARFAALERQARLDAVEVEPGFDAAALSDEEWAEAVLASAKACSTDDLEVYVREYLDRRRFDLVVIKDEIRAVRRPH